MHVFPHPGRDEIDPASVFRALGDPTRLACVLRLVAEGPGGELTCSDFYDLAQKSLISHHFRTLREAGITRTRLQGVRRFASIRDEDLAARVPGLLVLLRGLASKRPPGRRSARVAAARRRAA
jgi:DNA-binding transcriptional ArsR family regulator